MRDNRSQPVDPKSAANQVRTPSFACIRTRKPTPAGARAECNFIGKIHRQNTGMTGRRIT